MMAQDLMPKNTSLNSLGVEVTAILLAVQVTTMTLMFHSRTAVWEWTEVEMCTSQIWEEAFPLLQVPTPGINATFVKAAEER